MKDNHGEFYVIGLSPLDLSADPWIMDADVCLATVKTQWGLDWEPLEGLTVAVDCQCTRSYEALFPAHGGLLLTLTLNAYEGRRLGMVAVHPIADATDHRDAAPPPEDAGRGQYMLTGRVVASWDEVVRELRARFYRRVELLDALARAVREAERG